MGALLLLRAPLGCTGLHKSSLLATYRGHPGLQYRLRSNCRVNLSFGLHAGWAIEGAVGTEFKIEARPRARRADRLAGVFFAPRPLARPVGVSESRGRESETVLRRTHPGAFYG